MAFSYATRKETDKKRDKVVQIAKNWFSKGYDPSVIAQGIWNKYGYQADVKNEVVRIWGRYNDEPASSIRIVREITSSN